MEWVKREMTERRARADKASLIENSVADLWKNLCAAIRDSIKAYEKGAESRGEVVRSNGQAYVTCSVEMIIRQRDGATVPERKMTATLDYNKPEIMVSYEGKAKCTPLQLTFCTTEGAAALCLDDKPISAEAAAEAILRPFLFPDSV